MVLTASTAMADWLETFSGGTYDQSTWAWGSISATGPGPGLNSVVSNTLQLQANDPALPDGGAASAYGVVTGESFTDVRVSGTINPSGDSDLNADVGLLARTNVTNLTGYALTIDYSYDVGNVDLNRIDPGPDVETLVTGQIPDFETGDSVYVEFDLFGSNLTGRFYDAPGGTLLEEISWPDGTYTTGVSGVVANSEDNLGVILRGTYDNVGSQTIPEPGSLVLLGSGGLCALGCWWRKRRRGKA
jgi:hypothetical protein